MADLLKKDEIEAHTLLTVKEVREVFGIARSTVYRWIDRCWLRKAGQVQAPEDYKNQKIVLLDLVDEDLLDQFAGWVRSENEAGRKPRFFADDLARVDPLPEEEVDPRLESKRLVGELERLMGRLDNGSEERSQLVEELDAAPAIQPSGLKQAEVGLKEIVDLLKEISVREDDLRDETVEAPAELGVPPQAAESEDFIRELGEERGTGLEQKESAPEELHTEDAPSEDLEVAAEGDIPEVDTPEDDTPEGDTPEDDTSEDGDDPRDLMASDDDTIEGQAFGLDLGDTSPFEGLQPEQIAEFAFLADPETLGEDGEWIELNIDEGENPLLKEELVALDESFLPGAKRRGIEIDFEKGMLSETELDELAAAEEAEAEDPDTEDPDADLQEPVPDAADEDNDSWLGISLSPEQEPAVELDEDPYDPTGNLLEGEELRLLHGDVDEEDVDGFSLETEDDPAAQAELLDLDIQPADEGWGDDDAPAFDEGARGSAESSEELTDVLTPTVNENSDTQDEPVEEAWYPLGSSPQSGIQEDMLIGDDAVDLEPDDHFRELDEAFAAEEAETEDRAPDEETLELTADGNAPSVAESTPDEADVDNILASVDAGSATQATDGSDPKSLTLEDLEDPQSLLLEDLDEADSLSLEDLEDGDDVLMSLDDLDEDLGLAVEIDADESAVPAAEETPIPLTEIQEPQLEPADETPTETEEVSATEAPADTDEAVAEPEQAADLELQPLPRADAAEEVEESTVETETEPVPVAAQSQATIEPEVAVSTPAAGQALTAEALETSAEMIKEGMIGIRLSILEVKEGLGILQDPVDSVSRNTEKVSEGVREIANEARETRRSIEELGSRIENLDLSTLRSSIGPRAQSSGNLMTWIGLALLVLTWCLGLYLRGQGSTNSLYAVFGANLVITFAILMVRTPRAVLEE